MRKLFIIGCVFGTIAEVSALASSPTQVYNLGFEAGNFDEWTNQEGLAGLFESGSGGLEPFEGRYALGLSLYETADEVNRTSISRSLDLFVNQRIDGHARFVSQDYLPYNDYGGLYITGPNTNAILFFSDVRITGTYTVGKWIGWSFTAPETGIYTMTLSIANALDGRNGSSIHLDAGTIPEPKVWGMFLAGFGVIGFQLRQRRAKLSCLTARRIDAF